MAWNFHYSCNRALPPNNDCCDAKSELYYLVQFERLNLLSLSSFHYSPNFSHKTFFLFFPFDVFYWSSQQQDAEGCGCS